MFLRDSLATRISNPEHKIRLVADVVTGKLDVREAATKLPEAPAMPTASEETAPDEVEELPEEAAQP